MKIEKSVNRFAAEIGTDTLMDYGYLIAIMSTRNHNHSGASSDKPSAHHQINANVVSDYKASYRLKFQPRMNFKQEEFIEKLFKQVKEKFPEIELIEVTESAEDPNGLWVMVTTPENEDREIALSEYAAEIETDIFDGLRVSYRDHAHTEKSQITKFKSQINSKSNCQ